jgi:hypothetical protein
MCGVRLAVRLGIPNLLAVIAEDLAIFDCKLDDAVQIEPGLRPQSPKSGVFQTSPETVGHFAPGLPRKRSSETGRPGQRRTEVEQQSCSELTGFCV